MSDSKRSRVYAQKAMEILGCKRQYLFQLRKGRDRKVKNGIAHDSPLLKEGQDWGYMPDSCGIWYDEANLYEFRANRKKRGL